MPHPNHPNDLSILYHKQQIPETVPSSHHSSFRQSSHKHSITQTSTNLDLDSLMVGLRMVPNSQKKVDGFGVKIREVREKLKEIEGMWPGLAVEVGLVFGVIQRMEGKYYGGIRRKEAIGDDLFNSRMIIQKDSSLMGQQQALHQQSRTNSNKARLSVQQQANPYSNTLLPNPNTRSQSRLHVRRKAISSSSKSRIIYTEFSIKQLQSNTVRKPQHQHFIQPQPQSQQGILQLSLNPKPQHLSTPQIHQHSTNQHILSGKPSSQQQYLVSGFNQEDSQLCRLNRHIMALDEVLQNRVFRKVGDFVSVEGGRVKGNDDGKRVALGEIRLENCIKGKLMGGDVGKGRVGVGKGKRSRGNDINKRTRANLSDKQNRF